MYLYLLHSEVQEGVLIAHTDQALGTLASHAGPQASVQLHHHQFVQALSHTVRQASSSNLIIGVDLEEMGKERRWSKRNTCKVLLMITGHDQPFDFDSESAYNLLLEPTSQRSPVSDLCVSFSAFLHANCPSPKFFYRCTK